MSNQTVDNDAAFEALMSERLESDFGAAAEDTSAQVTDERLREMNKKLPAWDLEPPFTFLK